MKRLYEASLWLRNEDGDLMSPWAIFDEWCVRHHFLKVNHWWGIIWNGDYVYYGPQGWVRTPNYPYTEN